MIPLTVEQKASCLSFTGWVSLKDGLATLHIVCSGEGGEYGVELVTDMGDPNFYLQKEPFHYMAVISNTGHLAYMKYDGQATLWSSCEYERIG